jgi:hypothetical protein
VQLAKLLIAVLMILSAESSWAEASVVLVTGKDSPVEQLSSLDIRKAYLGILVRMEDITVHPVRRRDDERLNQIFLQSVIAMSQRSYERRLLSLVLRFGTPRPVIVSDHDALVQELTSRPIAIGYMWKSDAEADDRVRIIKVLWQET